MNEVFGLTLLDNAQRGPVGPTVHSETGVYENTFLIQRGGSI